MSTGAGLADITVRQNIQLHWVRIESLADILDRLREVGLSTTEACGDCVRNIINCPVSGVNGDELYDTTELITQVNDFFVGNRDFSNLPGNSRSRSRAVIFDALIPRLTT